MNPEPSLPSLDAMTSAAEWNESNMLHNSSSTGEVPPTIPSMDYDAFAGVSPAPRLKMESHSGYRSPPEASQYPSPHSQHALPVTMGGYSSASSTSNYMTEHSSHSWSRSEYPPLEPEPYRLSGPSYLEPAGRSPSLSQRAVTHRAPRTKQRRLTTRDEANFQCDVKGCGKLFSRSYNFKAHLETHDEKREYPFPCQVEGCTKKFVRKTDLSRHHQSVHMKERNHKCDFCGRTFARKDTLRRHMEDGCSKRFDISTLNVRNEGYDLHGARSSSRMGHIPSTQLPPLTASQTRSSNLSNKQRTDREKDTQSLAHPMTATTATTTTTYMNAMQHRIHFAPKSRHQMTMASLTSDLP
ncbi:hypothetical protein PG984_006862 [Apiospora sp. TS-2023a]